MARTRQRSSSPTHVAPSRRCILKLGYTCNNRCIFCHSQEHKQAQWLPLHEVCARLEAIWAAGFDEVLFSGGEPTIHPNFLEIANFCHQSKRRFGVISNARMFASEPFFRQVLNAGLDYVYLSLHGGPTTHEAMTRVPGSYAQTLRAIQRLSQASGVETTINMVLTTRNMNEAPLLARTFAPHSRNVRLKFSLVEPRGAALDDNSLFPHPAAAASVVSKAAEVWFGLGGKRSALGVDGIPHCLLPGLADLQDDMYTHGIVALQELADRTLFAVDYNNMAKGEACRGCLIGDECRCTWSGTLEKLGEEWLKPVRGFLPNSYNYLPLQTPPQQAAEAAKRGRKRRSDTSGRVLCVDAGDGPKAYATDTGDFNDQQLERIVNQLGQVYYQEGEELFLDDFAGQIRKLVKRVGEAQGEAQGQGEKPITGTCTGTGTGTGGEGWGEGEIWELGKKGLFLEADEPVREVLDRVRGKVADVGCGPAQYFERLLPGIRRRDVEYVGIDPRPGRVIEEAEARGEVVVQRCGIEDAVLPRGSLDWALVLRSHNHLADLWRAYRRIVGALKWGGHLLVVDNVAFGLVRPAVTQAEIQAVPAGEGLEHVRDHDGEMAMAFFRRFPLRLLQQRHLGPDTANQWVLLYQKAWPSGEFGEDGFQ